MNNEFTKGWLQWVLGFIETDISKLSLREKHTFFKRFNWFASHDLFDTSFDPFGKWSQYSQNQLIEFEASALKIQVTLKEFIDQITTHATYGLPDLTSFIRPEGLWPPSPKDHHIYFQAHSVPKNPTPKNWAILNLSRLIQGLEMHVIGKCKECQRYFLNFSLREKIYCGPKCASRSLARSREERWGANKYSTYLKDQRRRANKGYEKKREAMGKIVHHRHMPIKKSVVKTSTP